MQSRIWWSPKALLYIPESTMNHTPCCEQLRLILTRQDAGEKNITEIQKNNIGGMVYIQGKENKIQNFKNACRNRDLMKLVTMEIKKDYSKTQE